MSEESSPISNRELLKRLLKERLVQQIRYYPLSFIQEQLWIINQLDPESSVYNEYSAYSFTGLLNIENFEKSIYEIVSKHSSLRTIFILNEGKPVQTILPFISGFLEVLDASTFTLNSNLDLNQYLIQEISSPFSLSKGPLIKIKVVKISKEKYVFLICMHHIITDAWSMELFIKELSNLYNALCLNVSSNLAPLKYQYFNWAQFERQQYIKNVFAPQVNFWKNQLKDYSELKLKTNFKRPVHQTFNGSKCYLHFSNEFVPKIQKICKQEKVTPFMFFLSVFKILLVRYSEQLDIVIGSSIANRNYEEFKELIGCFTNTIILRTDLSGNPTFLELLNRIRSTTLDAYKNHNIPYQIIVKEIQPLRHKDFNPIFNVMFVFQNIQKQLFELNNININEIPISTNKSKLDLTLMLWECEDGYKGFFEYNTDLFYESYIEKIIGDFRTLIEDILQVPEKQIFLYNIFKTDNTALPNSGFAKQLSVKELLNPSLQDNELAFKDRNLVKSLEDQVLKTPNSIAIVFNQQQLTYIQLNKRINQLAHYLKEKGVKKETLVPILVDRGTEMMIAIWGVLKAGGAFVPVDPFYPKERISYILQDTSAEIVITSRAFRDKLEPKDILVVELDGSDEEAINNSNSEVVISLITSNQLAYVIYTSGTTGEPKGVMIEHKNLLNYLYNSKTGYITDEKTNSGSFIHLSYMFDASITAFFMPILAGKLIVIASNQFVNVFDDPNLWKYAPYDFIKLTPVHLSLLKEAVPEINTRPLATKFVVGGEALSINHFEDFVERGLDAEVVNEYGPTEATVGCTTYSFYISKNKEELRDSIPIGKPLDNVTLYVLGKNNEIQKVGIAGELHIGGTQLARGYLNRVDLTAEKFIDNPFGDEAIRKLYKTGDLVRWLPNGNLEFLGRIDDQVKIRGYRVELGEIESVLHKHYTVRHAVVLLRNANNSGGKGLIGYIVPVKDFDPEKIQEYLRSVLPEYMVPLIWVELNNFPITSYGKVDKTALLNIEIKVKENYVLPSNAIEIKLVEIWSKILHLDKSIISVTHDFFQLGGNSLDATILIHKISKEINVDIPLREIFLKRSINALSDYILTVIQLQTFESNKDDTIEFNL